MSYSSVNYRNEKYINCFTVVNVYKSYVVKEGLATCFLLEKQHNDKRWQVDSAALKGAF